MFDSKILQNKSNYLWLLGKTIFLILMNHSPEKLLDFWDFVIFDQIFLEKLLTSRIIKQFLLLICLREFIYLVGFLLKGVQFSMEVGANFSNMLDQNLWTDNQVHQICHCNPFFHHKLCPLKHKYHPYKCIHLMYMLKE